MGKRVNPGDLMMMVIELMAKILEKLKEKMMIGERRFLHNNNKFLKTLVLFNDFQ